MFKIFQFCFLILCASAIAVLSFLSFEIDKTTQIINFLKTAPITSNNGEYSISKEGFTTVIHINKPLSPAMCQKIIQAKLSYPHLFYAEDKLIDINSKNVCDNIKTLSLQHNQGKIFTTKFNCFEDNQCPAVCSYGFCKDILRN